MSPTFSSAPSPANACGRLLVECLTLDPAALAPRLAALDEAQAAVLTLQAGEHGIGPYLRRRLIAAGCFQALPPGARGALDAQYRYNAAKALARRHQLGVLLGQLAERQIPVIALKGAYLAHAVYPQPALRPMADLDLLFRDVDITNVHKLLEADGYRQEGVQAPIEWLTARQHQLPGYLRKGAEKIEVHMHITTPDATLSIDREGLWARARQWPLDGRPLWTLAPEDLLLHLCLHAVYNHRCRIGLSALVDVALVLERESLSWDALIARAQQWHAAPYGAIGLRLCQRLLGAAVPEAAIERLERRRNVDSWLALAESEILAQRGTRSEAQISGTDVDLKLALLWGGRFKALRGRQAKLHKLSEMLFPPTEVLAAKYPRLGRSHLRRIIYLGHWTRPLARLIRALLAGHRRLGAWHALDETARSYDEDRG